MKEITYNNQKKEIPDSLEELSPRSITVTWSWY